MFHTKTILITGSCGFTGPYVAKLFREAGYRVVGAVHRDPGDEEIFCDFTDRSVIQRVIEQVKPDGVTHLAGLSFVGHGDATAFYQVNTVGTVNLLEAMDHVGLNPEKVIIASSANVYGNRDVLIIDERTTPNPLNHYAASKLAMEYMVKTWYERFPLIITRPFNYTGVGQDEEFLIPKIVSHYRARKTEIELGNLDVSRDFSDVRDVARSYQKLFESSANSETVNLCSGRTVELREIVRLMNTLAGYEIVVAVNPAFIRKNEIKVQRGSNEKLKELVGFSPAIPFVDTLNNMYQA